MLRGLAWVWSPLHAQIARYDCRLAAGSMSKIATVPNTGRFSHPHLSSIVICFLSRLDPWISYRSGFGTCVAPGLSVPQTSPVTPTTAKQNPQSGHPAGFQRNLLPKNGSRAHRFGGRAGGRTGGLSGEQRAAERANTAEAAEVATGRGWRRWAGDCRRYPPKS